MCVVKHDHLACSAGLEVLLKADSEKEASCVCIDEGAAHIHDGHLSFSKLTLGTCAVKVQEGVQKTEPHLQHVYLGWVGATLLQLRSKAGVVERTTVSSHLTKYLSHSGQIERLLIGLAHVHERKHDVDIQACGLKLERRHRNIRNPGVQSGHTNVVRRWHQNGDLSDVRMGWEV